MRIATIDIGTNSVLLLITEWLNDHSVAVRAEHAIVTRLGAGVDRNGYLKEDAMARTLACLDTYAAIVKKWSVARLVVSGTSAFRDASNAQAFQTRIEEHFAKPMRILSGQEEATLTFAGALQDLPLRGELMVVDIGGGSTEVVLGHWDGQQATIQQSVSANVGSVRLTERYLTTDPPSQAECDLVIQDVRTALVETSHWGQGIPVIAVAGTATTLASVAGSVSPTERERIHNTLLTREALDQTLQRLRVLPLSQRSKVVGLAPERAGVIVAGGLILQTVMNTLGLSHLVISDRGLRWGLAQATWNALKSDNVAEITL